MFKSLSMVFPQNEIKDSNPQYHFLPKHFELSWFRENQELTALSQDFLTSRSTTFVNISQTFVNFILYHTKLHFDRVFSAEDIQMSSTLYFNWRTIQLNFNQSKMDLTFWLFPSLYKSYSDYFIVQPINDMLLSVEESMRTQ